MRPHCSSNKGEEALLEDVEDSGEEESQSKKNQQLVCQLTSVVLEDQFSAQMDGSRHAFELLVGFLDRP